MIRNVCIHVSNEQPLLCDLYALPSANDAGLICTNVRSMDGKRPIFIDHTASTFFFPYHVVRFLEIPEHEMQRVVAEGGGVMPAFHAGSAPRAAADPSPDLAADGRVAGPGPDGAAATGHEAATPPEPGSLLPVAVAPGAQAADELLDLEIDEDFLRRVRDI